MKYVNFPCFFLFLWKNLCTQDLKNISFTPPKTAFLGTFAIHKKQSSVWCSYYHSDHSNFFSEAFKTLECHDTAYLSIQTCLIFMFL